MTELSVGTLLYWLKSARFRSDDYSAALSVSFSYAVSVVKVYIYSASHHKAGVSVGGITVEGSSYYKTGVTVTQGENIN